MHGARLIYLSPYSPDFNPIENCCSVKNSCVSVAARSRFGFRTSDRAQQWIRLYQMIFITTLLIAVTVFHAR